MAIDAVIKKGVNTIFKVLKSLVHSATFTAVSDDGFGTITTVPYSIDIIIDSFSERDVQFLSFSEYIQPQDVKGMIKGEQIPIFPSSKDYIEVAGTGIFSGKFSVIACTTDPAAAVYTVLLRRV